MTYSQVKNYLLSFIYNNPSSKIRGQVVQTAIQGSLDTTVGFSCIRFPNGTLTTNDIGKIVGNNNGVAALPRIINRYVGSPNSTVGQCEYPLLGQLVDIDGSDAIISGSAQFATKLSPESVPVSFAQTSPPSDINDYPYRALCVNEDGWLIAVSTILNPLLFGSDIPNNWGNDSLSNQFYIAITAATPGGPIVVQQCFGTPLIPLATGGGVITTVTVNVTSSQILNSFTSPVTLLPAPGNGLQWNVLSYQGYYTFGSSPYTATGFIGLMQGDVNNIIDGYLDIFNTILLNAPNSTQFKGAVGSNNYSVNSISLYNQPVQFYSDTANPTGGDGSFSITIIAVLTS